MPSNGPLKEPSIGYQKVNPTTPQALDQYRQKAEGFRVFGFRRLCIPTASEGLGLAALGLGLGCLGALNPKPEYPKPRKP